MREDSTWGGRTALMMAVLAAAGLAGCGSGGDAAAPTAEAAEARPLSTAATRALVANVARARRQQLDASPVAASRGAMPVPTLVAAAPDSGELARAVAGARSASEGAWRWHRVDVSEAHALASLSTGHMVLRTPSGERLTLDYARHEEHASGDWTWVGSVRELGTGLDRAVITFGAHAVFARIPQPGGRPPLALVMREGAVWLGETSREALARWRPPQSRDFAVPGVHARHADDAPAASALARDAVARSTPGMATVDLIVGYSRSFRALHGGTPQAITRTHHLVALANGALEASQVDGRLRLLHTTEVDYPDGPANDIALYQLTGIPGYPVPPSLADLHGRLRQAHGADLVALLRPFQLATSGACGYGWLVGENGAPITPAWSIYGFSVSGDGFDQGWSCEELTLAHELGHNMGLAHDRENSQEDGVLWSGAYPWAFGYKTRQPDGIGFADIMAYPDYGQPSVLAFSNPQLSYLGIPFGTPDDDASRALRLTMPAVAGFLGTQVPEGRRVPNDVDGNGTSDILVHDPAARTLAQWRMQGHQVDAAPAPQVHAAGLSPAATGDFDGDGRADVLWRSAGGELRLWHAAGDGWTESTVGGGVLPASTTIAGAADFNGDGRDELLLVDGAGGEVGYWTLADGSRTRVASAPGHPDASPVASGDLDGDGRDDLLWMTGARELVVWWGNAPFGEAGTTLPGGPLAPGWTVGGIADVDGDGGGDLLFFHAAKAQSMWWAMNGAEVVARSAPRPGLRGTLLQAHGDFDGDGDTDLLVRTRARELRLWTSDGQVLPATTPGIRRLPSATSRVLGSGVPGPGVPGSGVPGSGAGD